MHGYTDLLRAFHYVVVGHDVTVGGNDHTAANPMLHVRLGAHKATEVGAEVGTGVWAKELLHVIGQLRLRRLDLGGHSHVHHRRRNASRQCLHGLIEGKQSAHAAGIEWRCGRSRCRCGRCRQHRPCNLKGGKRRDHGNCDQRRSQA